ncbi:MAG: hypothetical protein M9894_36645 [Planctomycetes bacterium]|nr:hypothetical protein [Planctomycetota bacterium]
MTSLERRIAPLLLVLVGCDGGRVEPPPLPPAAEAPRDAEGQETPPAAAAPSAEEEAEPPAPGPAPEVLQELRALAQRLHDEEDLSARAELHARLQTHAALFPRLEVGTQQRRPAWHRIRFNQRLVGFDAFRFTTPPGEPRDFVWALSVPYLRSWFITPVKPSLTMRGFRRFSMTEHGGHRFVLQFLDASDLTPGEDYVIWLLLKEPASVSPALLGLACLPPGQATQNARDLLRAMGDLPDPGD